MTYYKQNNGYEHCRTIIWEPDSYSERSRIYIDQIKPRYQPRITGESGRGWLLSFFLEGGAYGSLAGRGPAFKDVETIC